MSLRNHLTVRDALRSDPLLCEEYAQVKREVAAVAADIDEYGRGKNATIQRVLASAGLSESELASINGNVATPHDQIAD